MRALFLLGILMQNPSAIKDHDSGIISAIKYSSEVFWQDGKSYKEYNEQEILFRLDGYKHCGIRYGQVTILDWNNLPVNFYYLRNGDYVDVEYHDGTPYWIAVVRVRPRPVITNFDFTRITEEWIADNTSINVPSDIFNQDEIKLLKDLDSSHPTDGFEIRQKAMHEIRNMNITAAQKFLVHAPKFYAKKAEVIFRLNFLKAYFYSYLDLSYLPERIYRYAIW